MIGLVAVDSLRFVLPDGSRPRLPAWASWFLAAGGWLWQSRAGGTQSILAISVPTREYGSLLAALGLVGSIAPERPGFDQAQALERVGLLKIGTTVRFRSGRYLRVGVFQRIERRPDGQVCVCIKEGRGERLVPASLASTIEPLDPGARPNGRARPIGQGLRLVLDVLEVDPQSFEAGSSMDCLIVGPKERLDLELNSVVGSGPAGPAGCLADLLRPRTKHSGRECFRTDVVSSLGHEISELDRHGSPSDHACSSVLDGSSAVIRCLDRVGDGPVIAILDRTDNAAAEAASVLASYRASGVPMDLSTMATPPAAIEVVGFRRKRRDSA